MKPLKRIIKQLMPLSASLMLTGLLLSPAMAADTATGAAQQAAPTAGQAAQQVTTTETKKSSVSQAQIDLATKREEARQRRDALLKIRAAARAVQ